MYTLLRLSWNQACIASLAGNFQQLTACVLSCGGGGCAGSSYPEFIQSMHLPAQLAEVDPIVASFCGGAVGVVSALLVVEVRLPHILCPSTAVTVIHGPQPPPLQPSAHASAHAATHSSAGMTRTAAADMQMSCVTCVCR